MTMDDATNCSKMCWKIAAVVGIVFALLMLAFGFGWVSGLLLGVVVFVICGFVLSTVYCSDAEAMSPPPVSPSNTTNTIDPQAPADTPEAKPTATSAPSPVPEAPAAAPPADAAPADAVPPDAEPVPVDPDDAPPAATAQTVAAKPETLSAARGGAPDNLKLIKGVGPKLEALLNQMGFYHFDQIAGWTDKEVGWVDENLQGFKGRVSRDNWVAQARTLAAGDETEFSKRSKGKG